MLPMTGNIESVRENILLCAGVMAALFCLSPGASAQPELHCLLRHPGKLDFNDSLGVYEPHPITIILSCRNIGNQAASNVTGFLYVPEGLELIDSSDSLRKAFPDPMPVWKEGDTLPGVCWQLRLVDKVRYDRRLDIRGIAGGSGPAGMPLDSNEHRDVIHVRGLAPSYACLLRCPDSLALNPEGNAVVPDPFTVEYVVRNSGHISGDIILVDIDYPTDLNLSLDVSTPKTRSGTMHLDPGDSLTVRWLFHAGKCETARTAGMAPIAYTEDGDPVLNGPEGACSKDIHIAGVGSSHIQDMGSTDFLLGANSPNPFNESTTIRYELGFEAYARLTVHDVLGRRVAALVDERQQAGRHSVRFDASELPSGVYVYRLETAEYCNAKRMVVAR